jgi:hypothetical protein
MAYDYNASGVLILDRVTPVIRALFGVYPLDENSLYRREAYFTQVSGTNEPLWSGVLAGLTGLAAELGLVLSDQCASSIPTVLSALAEHFGTGEEEEMKSLLQHYDFHGGTNLDVLFLIATRLNDGHNLVAIQSEACFKTCWFRGAPQFSEFSGEAFYRSREVRIHGDTWHVAHLGSHLRQAVLKADVDGASRAILQETEALLSGIHDGQFRQCVRQQLAERLSSWASAIARSASARDDASPNA